MKEYTTITDSLAVYVINDTKDLRLCMNFSSAASGLTATSRITLAEIDKLMQVLQEYKDYVVAPLKLNKA